MIRRFGQPPRTDVKYHARPGVYAVLLRGSEMLLTFQEEPEPEFQLPGGGVDKGEAPILALHREVYEETGWTITAPKRWGAFRRFAYMPEYDLWAEKICTIYFARPARRLGPPTEPLHRAVWLPTEEAINTLTNSGDQHFAAKCLR